MTELLRIFCILFEVVAVLAFIVFLTKFVFWPILKWCINESRKGTKEFILLVLVLFSLTANAQFKPKAAISYNITDQIRIANPIGDAMTYYLPKFNFRSGLEYTFKNVSIYYDMQFWCLFAKDSFLPEQSSFEVGIKYAITDKIKITINHVCYHPLRTEHHLQNGIYGGHQGITLSYGY